ncbi:lipoprotein [Spiroplasma alleghenense]|uniref:Lipoprotein n=1 Tax=Spiroplasma alleghenense TaxID=216931 RepID=A0A345Z3F6_9MOLU|nr:lipoprotein [Spiroplasma alleghenense]AXK51135.1 hypothetical protein SALLE_v1c04610 [Spiroplasma alleghenense]
MKKLLGLLGAVGLTVSTASAVVACGQTKDEEDNKIDSGDLGDEKVISVKNVVVNRNVSRKDLLGEGADNSKITNAGIVEGLNYANNTSLEETDVEIEFQNTEKTMATITATEGSKFTGTVNIYINFDVNIENIILNTKIGDVYISNDVWADKSSPIVLATLLMEFIGDKNPILEIIADQILKFSTNSMLVPESMIVEEELITLNFNLLDDPKCFIKGKITISFNQKDDTRLTIKQAVTNTDLGKIADNQTKTILKRLYELNKSNMKDISEEVFIKNTIVDQDDDGEYFIQFVAGTSIFKGHDDMAAFLAEIDSKDIQLPITFTV